MKNWQISRATRIKVDAAISIWLAVNLAVTIIPIWV